MVLSASKCRSRSIGKSELAAHAAKFDEAHVAEFGRAQAEIAESEGETAVGIELGQEPGGATVGSEELDDGLEVECTGSPGRSRRVARGRWRGVVRFVLW